MTSNTTKPCSEKPQCSLCSDPLDNTKHICINGHLLCKRCRIALKDCTLCHTNIKPYVKQISMMELLPVKSPCPYRDSGCKGQFDQHQMPIHLAKCLSRLIYDCRVRKGPKYTGNGYDERKCPWRGTKENLVKHVEACHPKLFSGNGRAQVRFRITGVTENHIRMVESGGSYFWLVLFYCPRNRRDDFMLTYVRSIGEDSAVDRYQATFQFNSINGRSTLQFTDRPHTLRERVEETSGVLRLDEVMLGAFLKDDVIKCTVKVEKMAKS